MRRARQHVFVRFCDAFNIPLVTLVDVPGFMARSGTGNRRHYQQRCQIAVRLCRGHRAKGDAYHPQGPMAGAYDVMASKHLRGDVNYAWPSAEIAVMGPEGAARIIFSRGCG